MKTILTGALYEPMLLKVISTSSLVTDLASYVTPSDDNLGTTTSSRAFSSTESLEQNSDL
jgi:hypothetical protein